MIQKYLNTFLICKLWQNRRLRTEIFSPSGASKYVINIRKDKPIQNIYLLKFNLIYSILCVYYNSFIVSVIAVFLIRFEGLYTAAADDKIIINNITATVITGTVHASPQ